MLSLLDFRRPCQPFSLAGKQKGDEDERNMWPATRRIIEIARPKRALLENVPGIISCGYIGEVLKDLAEIGYDARWKTISAQETGHCHKRERLWIVAHANTVRKS